jgi:hypothetical protein
MPSADAAPLHPLQQFGTLSRLSRVVMLARSPSSVVVEVEVEAMTGERWR